MTARILKGSKQEIAQKLANMEGDVREAIVFIQEPAAGAPDSPKEPVPETVEEMFNEMEPYMAHSGGNVDDSREAIYTRQPGE